ncbi:hypothetical protein FO519_010189 [Halicephalobus sp. NKZ332]|nr:hypothetical protein FO519_010189 [Halicephalobus sp. NKZ332]
MAQSTLWVNENGILSFVGPIHDFKPWCNPVVTQYRMIAPFWADVDTRCSGEVYFRQTTNDSVLKKANQEIANAFPEMHNIHLKWAFIATWYNVTSFQDLECKDEEDRLRNTFQVSLVTNGTSSFAIYYYNEIEWTTGDVSNGIQAQAGYDFGDRTHRASLNGSCTPAVINLTLTSNVNSPGKWILNTQPSAAPPPPECQYNYTGDFCLIPNTIDALGGVSLAVSGITLSSTETAICRYYDPSANVTEIDAEVSKNEYSKTCDISYPQ